MVRHRAVGVATAVVTVLAGLSMAPTAAGSVAHTPPVSVGLAVAVAADDDVVAHEIDDDVARRRIQKWPGRTIRYWVDAPSSFTWPIKKGVEAWNRTGLGIRFVQTSKARSQLTIRTTRLGGPLGRATIGYTPVRKQRWVKLEAAQLGTRVWGTFFTRDERRVFTALVVAHELGHTLGLGHRSVRCGLMGPTLYGGSCPLFAPQVGYYGCRGVSIEDLRRAVRLYGGRATQPPPYCPLDPLPPALTGVTITGGGETAAPGVVRWTPPARAPAGSTAQVLVRTDGKCDFKPRATLRTMAYYPAAVAVRRLALGVRIYSQSATRNRQLVCFGARSVNASGAGAALRTGLLELWVPKPPTPTLHWVRRPYSSSGGWYTSKIGLPAGVTPESVYFQFGDEGACPTVFSATTWTQGWPENGFMEAYDELDRQRPCLAVAVYARGRASDLATFQVGSEPPPAAPALGPVERVRSTGEYRFKPAVGTSFEHDVLALVRPAGQCAPATWPAAEDKDQALADEWDGWYSVYSEVSEGCVTVYQIDGLGRVGPGTSVQTPPAPDPVTPTITNASMVIDGEGYPQVRFTATFDESALDLVVVEGPAGDCATVYPPDGSGELYAYREDTWWLAYTWAEDPCVSWFTRNADNEYSAAFTKQF